MIKIVTFQNDLAYQGRLFRLDGTHFLHWGHHAVVGPLAQLPGQGNAQAGYLKT
jgi:hypothetical protein